MKNRGNYLMTAAAAVASVGLLYGLIQSIICKGIASSEAAGWAQTIGAIAAIAAAIWIAQGQERTRHKEALNTAHVAAAIMTFRARTVVIDLKAIVGLLEQHNPNEGNYGSFKEVLQLLETQPLWDAAEVARLTPLSSNCAYRLAAAIDRLYVGTYLVRNAVRVRDAGAQYDHFFRKEEYGRVISVLTEAIGLYELAIKEMQLAIDRFTKP